MLREKEKKQRLTEKNGHALPQKALNGLNGYRPSDKEPFMNETSPTAHPPKPTAPSSCAPATASAS
jgi:hypothetical protein